MPQNEENKLNIELSEDVAGGVYSNLALIVHSPVEFVFDFIRVVPGRPQAKVYSRIIMAPQHAKGFLRALSENIQKYENQFGEIQNPGSSSDKPVSGFQH
jgi:hypothetical protein